MTQLHIQTLDAEHKLAANIPECEEEFVRRHLANLRGNKRFIVMVHGRGTRAEVDPEYGTYVTKGEMIKWLSEHVFGGTLTAHLYNDLKKVLK